MDKGRKVVRIASGGDVDGAAHQPKGLGSFNQRHLTKGYFLGGGGDGGGPAEMVSRDVETTLGRTPKTEIILYDVLTIGQVEFTSNVIGLFLKLLGFALIEFSRLGLIEMMMGTIQMGTIQK